MKTGIIILLGFILSLIGILILANNIEDGDINAVSMYFVVYTIPAIGLSIINGFLLNVFQKRVSELKHLVLYGLIPIGILIISLFLGDLRMSFVAEFGLIGIGTTNFIWISLVIRRDFNKRNKARKPNKS